VAFPLLTRQGRARPLASGLWPFPPPFLFPPWVVWFCPVGPPLFWEIVPVERTSVPPSPLAFPFQGLYCVLLLTSVRSLSVEIDILMEESRVPIPTCIKRLANEMIGGSGQEANNPIGPILQKIMSPSLCT
jgi:hypothetical protein